MRAGNHMVLSCLTLYPVRPRIGAAWTRLCCGWIGRWTGGAIHMQVRSVAALIRKIQIAVGQRAKSGIKRGWRGGRIRTFPNVRNRRIYRSFQRDAQYLLHSALPDGVPSPEQKTGQEHKERP